MGILLIATTVACLAGICWALFVANRQHFPWEAPLPAPDQARGGVTRTTLLAPTASGDFIEAWFYRPEGPPRPVILMAPGLGGTKEGPLERFAWGFAEAGFSVLLFDFRSFGGSGGKLRHAIDLRDHVADYRAVIAHVRAGNAPGVDASRIVLWGTSFSGASAVCAGAADPVAAMVLHVPYLGRSAVQPGFIQMAGYVALVMAEMAGDTLARLVGVRLPPAYMTAYGRSGEAAFATSRDCVPRKGGASRHPFWASLPETYRGGWRNALLVRGLQSLDAIDPEQALKALACPVLVISATADDMINAADTREIASGARDVRLIEMQAGHFDPYVDPYFAANLAGQVDFLREALAGRTADAG